MIKNSTIQNGTESITIDKLKPSESKEVSQKLRESEILNMLSILNI